MSKAKLCVVRKYDGWAPHHIIEQEAENALLDMMKKHPAGTKFFTLDPSLKNTRYFSTGQPYVFIKIDNGFEMYLYCNQDDAETINLTDLRAAKSECEKAISDALIQFGKTTGKAIESVSIKNEQYGDSSVHFIRCECNLSIKI